MVCVKSSKVAAAASLGARRDVASAEASCQAPPAARPLLGRATRGATNGKVRTVRAAPVTALIGQVLLIAGIAVTIAIGGAGLSAAGWVVGVTCAVIMDAAVARGLSRYRSHQMGLADWV